MPNLYYAINELKLAKKKLEQLYTAYTVDGDQSIIDNWGAFLSHLEQCWAKAEHGFLDVLNKFGPIQGRFTKIIKEDEMLTYLSQARNAFQHSIREIIIIERISDVILTEIPPITITSESGEKVQAFFYPANLTVTEITNRNVTYKIPVTHRGKNLNGNGNPFEIGVKGIIFYADFLKTLHTQIIKKGTHADLDKIVERDSWKIILNYRTDLTALSKYIPGEEEKKYIISKE